MNSARQIVSKVPVTIVGNGVGAFTSALSLHRAGITNRVYVSRSKLINEQDGGIQGMFIGGSAVRILDRLGLGSKFRMIGCAIHSMEINDINGRKLLGGNLDGMLTGVGGEVWGMTKEQLLQMFVEAIPPDCVHYDCKLRSIRMTNDSDDVGDSGVQVNLLQVCDHQGRLADPIEHTVDTDFVIGADGIMSSVRMFMTRNMMTMSSGVTVWKAIVKHMNMNEIPLHHAREIWHQQKKFGYVRLSHDQVMWWATISTPKQQHYNQNQQHLQQPIRLRPFSPHLLSMFETFPKLVTKLILSVESDRNIERQELKRVWPWHSPWIDRSSWRMALVGDARRPASAETFHMSHSFAVDDGYILANVLVDHINKMKETAGNEEDYGEDEDNALNKYDENRKENLQAIRDVAKQAQWFCNAKSFPLRYISKIFLDNAVQRINKQSMSSIITPP